MNISRALIAEHSKKQTLLIGKYIGQSPVRFKEIVNLVASGDRIISQRAAWVLGTHGEEYPRLFLPHLSKLVPLLGKPVHDAVKRNILRVLQYLEIPSKFETEIINQCFNLLQSTGEPPAIKAFSISVIVNLSRKYPDLMQELTAWFQNNKMILSKAEIKRVEKAGLLRNHK